MQSECQRAAGQHESQLLSCFLNAGELFNSWMTRVGFPWFYFGVSFVRCIISPGVSILRIF